MSINIPFIFSLVCYVLLLCHALGIFVIPSVAGVIALFVIATVSGCLYEGYLIDQGKRDYKK